MIIPKLEDGKINNLYQYQYFFDIADKVYYTKSNLDMTKQLLKKWNVVRKNEEPKGLELLAADLKEEYFYHSSTSVNFKYIENFLKIHIGNFLGRKISELSFSGDNGYDLWVNYQTNYEHNPVHSHGGLYSFVWYLDIPEEIRNECYSQTSNSSTRGLIEFHSKMSNYSTTFNPETSDVFVFDSNHRHQVYPFYTDNTRVSMAGNIHSITFEDGEILTS